MLDYKTLQLINLVLNNITIYCFDKFINIKNQPFFIRNVFLNKLN